MLEFQSLLDFAPDSPEFRALELFHAEAERVHLRFCPLCLLLTVARAPLEPGASLESLRDEVATSLYAECGPVVSVCYDLLCDPTDSGLLARFREVEHLVQQRTLLEGTESESTAH